MLHLPSHIYQIDESPRFPAYYNLLKQEYVSARYRLYRATHQQEPEFAIRDVLLLDSGEGLILGHRTKGLRASFRSAYAIFDKVRLFLDDYFGLGIEPRKVTFRNVWFENSKRPTSEIFAKFKGHQNWPLRGLFSLSKDLFDKDFEEVAEPNAVNLSRLRNRVEHRCLSFQNFVTEECTDTHQYILIKEFEGKALHLLKIAREALIYLSLAIHREEKLREQASSDIRILEAPVVSRPIRLFDRW